MILIRLEDLEEFSYHFMEQANEELGKNVNSISNEALELLKQQSWMGNLRELRNVIRRSVLFAQDNTIRKDNLPEFPKIMKNQNIQKDMRSY